MNGNNWLIFEKALDPEWCDALIEHATENYTPQEGVIGFDDSKVDKNVRISEVRWLNVHTEKDVVNTIWQYADWANRDSFAFDLQWLNDIQFTKYVGSSKEPGKYDWHYDIDWSSNAQYHRKLSMVFMLTDPSEYEGGVFEFQNPVAPLPPGAMSKGTVIAFPSFFTHRVTPVTSGTRHTLVTWVEGPQFR